MIKGLALSFRLIKNKVILVSVLRFCTHIYTGDVFLLQNRSGGCPVTGFENFIIYNTGL